MAESKKNDPAVTPEAEDQTPTSVTQDDTISGPEIEAEAEDSLSDAGQDSLAADPEAPAPVDSLFEPDDAEAKDTLSGTSDDADSLTPAEDLLAADEVDPEATEADKETDSTPTPEDNDPVANDMATPETAADHPEIDPLAEAPEAPAPQPTPEVLRETVIERRAGLVPVLIGGVLAGAVGFGAGYYSTSDLPFLPRPESAFEIETRAALAEQADRIAAAVDQSSANSAALGGIDLGPLSDEIAGLRDGMAQSAADATARGASLTDQLAALSDRVDAIDARLLAKEKEPLVEAVSPEVVAAYERELDALQARVTAQSEEVAQQMQEQRDFIAEKRAEIEEMIATAKSSESSAAEQAALAQARAALAELMGAVEAGRAYTVPLSVIDATGAEIAPALRDTAAEGLPTLAALIEDWPAAAREALARARATDGAAPTVGEFAARVFGARSVKPREGTDPDAVLSRAEAALRQADLGTTLSEIEALPPEAQDALSEWTARARLRHDALVAAQDLALRLNAN